MTPRPRSHSRRAFSLVELMVASIIVVLIATATTTALSQMVRASRGAAARQQAFSRAFAAAGMIARDAAEAARDSDLLFAKVHVSDGGGEVQPRDGLLLLVRSLRRVRGADDLPEGVDFEVQYRIQEGASGPALWRRADPALDGAIDGGGMAMSAAEGVVSLSVEACDDQDWWPLWDSDSEGLPRAIRVVVTATDDSRRVQAVARKVIPLDRIPLPPPKADSAPAGAEGAS